jgi:tetratricopeptide (TPR) repeat protein
VKDHYQTLGLDRSASEKKIKEVYRELCKQYHPDHNKSPEAHTRMQDVNAAYHVLSSPVRRAEYDQLLLLQEKRDRSAAEETSARGTTEGCRCEKCGRVDPTLRVTVFTWVVSVLVITYRRGWAKVLCARCRTKYALLFDLQNFFMGWWGIPFGIFWTLQALWHNSLGGQQPQENNALFLAGLGYEFHRKGDLKAAASALKASLRFKKDPRVEAFYWQTQARFHETPAAYASERGPSLFQRFATGAFHPAVYCAPVLAILFGLVSLWAEFHDKLSVWARNGVALQQDDARKESARISSESNVSDSAQPAPSPDANSSPTVAPQKSALFTAGVSDEYGNLIHLTPEEEAEVNLLVKQRADDEKVGVQLFDNKEYARALEPLRRAAEGGQPKAQCCLASCYRNGLGVSKDEVEAVKWCREAAKKGIAEAQFWLGFYYSQGLDAAEGARWYRKAAEQGHAGAQNNLGYCYAFGNGVPKDCVEALKWLLLASIQDPSMGGVLPEPLQVTTPDQNAEAQHLVRAFRKRKAVEPGDSVNAIIDSNPASTGTGFFITEDGFFITNDHVVKEAAQIRVVTGAGVFKASVLKVDSANDLALMHVYGQFASLPVATTRLVRLGSSVATIGFPNIRLQGLAPKLAKGEISALSGAQDDPRYFQVSVPVQPGNSGGALVDERGNVVGVLAAKLSARAALATSGAIPENVNYAVKSSCLLRFLESDPILSAKLKRPHTKDRKFEDVVKEAEQAAALVVVY